MKTSQVVYLFLVCVSFANSILAQEKLDGAYERKLYKEKKVLSYDHLREADIAWEERIWRVIDIREKMNLPFADPKQPFVNILLKEASEGRLSAFIGSDDSFQSPLSTNELNSLTYTIDTIYVTDFDTEQERMTIVKNELNPSDIKRFRVKEVWLFDEETGSMQVRILGISPLREKYDDNGNFMFEYPMCWFYYPDMRNVLAHYECHNDKNDAARLTWEDVFEMRYFSSYITKNSNVLDRRIQDYKKGIDILFESEKIKAEILNLENDRWQN